jgi:hypothetical protein
MDARQRDLADLADNLSVASDYLRALEAAKPWRCKKPWIADRRINGLMRHTDKLISELSDIFEITGIDRPHDSTIDKFR